MQQIEPEPGKEGQGKTAMWLKLLWQLKELLPLLGRLLPLLEGWVAGNRGASEASSRALQQLEARLGSTQEGLGGVEGQIRDQSALLLHLNQELSKVQSQWEADRRRSEEQAAALALELSLLRKSVKIAMLAWILLVVAFAALVVLLLHFVFSHPGHSMAQP